MPEFAKCKWQKNVHCHQYGSESLTIYIYTNYVSISVASCTRPWFSMASRVLIDVASDGTNLAKNPKVSKGFGEYMVATACSPSSLCRGTKRIQKTTWIGTEIYSASEEMNLWIGRLEGSGPLDPHAVAQVSILMKLPKLAELLNYRVTFFDAEKSKWRLCFFPSQMHLCHSLKASFLSSISWSRRHAGEVIPRYVISQFT